MSRGDAVESMVNQLGKLTPGQRTNILFAAIYQRALEENVTGLQVLQSLTEAFEMAEEAGLGWESVRSELVIRAMDRHFNAEGSAP